MAAIIFGEISLAIDRGRSSWWVTVERSEADTPRLPS